MLFMNPLLLFAALAAGGPLLIHLMLRNRPKRQVLPTLRFLPEIIETKGGVMNVASTAAFQPGPNMAIYYASKAYVLSFSEAIWFELRGRARVTCLCPGPVPTGFAARAKKGGNLRLMKFSRTNADFVAARN